MVVIGKLLDPKIDYVFKRIFGHVENEEITTALVSSIIKKEITDLTLDGNTVLEKDFLNNKVGILDKKAKIDNNINCNIEMQVVDRKNIEKRILFYWSKMYNMSIKAGNDYDKLEKGIVILISDYEIEGLKEIEKFITKWNIREEEYQKVVLTDVMEIYIIELPKFEKYKKKDNNETLNSWVKFIENPEVVDMNENKEITKARKVLEEISQDEHERYLAELRQKHIMDQKAIEDAGYDKGRKKGRKEGREEGLEEGRNEGRKEGLEQGRKEEKITIAKNMKLENVSIDTICKVTGLTKEEVEKL